MSEKRMKRPLKSSGQEIALSHCPMCESSRHLSGARLLSEEGGRHLFYVQCAQCKSALLVLVFSDTRGTSSLSLLTDLSPDDVEHSWSQPSVNADDVLAFHTLIRASDASWILRRNGE
jgi:hypothetical protein